MAIDGKITHTDDDAITGWIASLTVQHGIRVMVKVWGTKQL